MHKVILLNKFLYLLLYIQKILYFWHLRFILYIIISWIFYRLKFANNASKVKRSLSVLTNSKKERKWFVTVMEEKNCRIAAEICNSLSVYRSNTILKSENVITKCLICSFCVWRDAFHNWQKRPFQNTVSARSLFIRDH